MISGIPPLCGCNCNVGGHACLVEEQEWGFGITWVEKIICIKPDWYTDHLLFSLSLFFQIEPKGPCVEALTKMSSCPACQGIPDIRPCPGYCINVMKGCLAYHAELGESWDKFIGKKETKNIMLMVSGVKGKSRFLMHRNSHISLCTKCPSLLKTAFGAGRDIPSVPKKVRKVDYCLRKYFWKASYFHLTFQSPYIYIDLFHSWSWNKLTEKKKKKLYHGLLARLPVSFFPSLGCWIFVISARVFIALMS